MNSQPDPANPKPSVDPKPRAVTLAVAVVTIIFEILAEAGVAVRPSLPAAAALAATSLVYILIHKKEEPHET